MIDCVFILFIYVFRNKEKMLTKVRVVIVWKTKLNRGLLLLSLQKKLQDVSMKFRLFQKPANFEQRLEESKMILDEVKMHLPALETKSVEQEVVQSQLNHCVVCISGGKYITAPCFFLIKCLIILFCNRNCFQVTLIIIVCHFKLKKNGTTVLKL